MSVGDMTVSPDGNLLAYTTDDTGFRQYTLRVKDLRTGKLGPEAIERVTSVAWAADGKTLFYSVEDPQPSAPTGSSATRWARRRTTLVYEEKDERFSVYVWKSRDRKLPVRRVGQPHHLRGALPARRPARGRT